ncbi:NADPH-dependent 7-cyano-7-deazaguanine reductase QueF [Aliiglaciecola sp.]|nr:NADPH-dependent 7-cyano-7-deazaguanine reductase QueF [Aliiglaciecola sp.]
MTKESTNKNQIQSDISHLTLGKSVEYATTYTPELLQAVPRSLSRNQIGLTEALPFYGEDLWNAYELSWLNSKGKPHVAVMQCTVPFDSPNLVESKSFKMYLNSFNQTRVESVDKLNSMICEDLSRCAGAQVKVTIILPEEFNNQVIDELPGHCIDDIDVTIDDYTLNPKTLVSGNDIVSETLTSNLLKSNCLITNQPDWGSVMVRYEGPQINRESLLKYLISFRMHNEFHEQCVERIFNDIVQQCHPEKLSVYARYTRRGGLDINPFRSNFEVNYPTARQARQ